MGVTNLKTTSGVIQENKGEEDKSDAELMAALADRDPDSMEQIYQRYEPVLRTVILGVLHGEGDADDVLHDVFLQRGISRINWCRRRGCMDFW